MRKLITSSWTKLAAVVAVMFFTVNGNAQVATNYAFSQISGVYTPITGGTVIATATVGGTGAASLDDVVYTNNAIPFAFTFNGIAYTTYNISTNGFITFGATAPTGTNYIPVSSAAGYAGAFAGFGRDCQGNVTAGNLGEIRTEVLGTWPNRVLVIQYSNFRRFGQTEDWDMQIVLAETSHMVSVVYNTPTVGASTVYPEVGLRGATNADFNNRTSTTSWAATTPGAVNNATIQFTPAVAFTAGQTFIWTPVNVCAGVPTAGTITGSASGCIGASSTLSLSGNSSGPGITYQWQSSTVSGGPYSNMGNNTTQATGPLSGTMYYVCVLTCTNGGGMATTPEFTITVNPNPTISVSPSTSNVCSGYAAIPLTASGSSLTYAWSPAIGLSATTGATVNAQPLVNTTYTVTGTDGNGCTATATSAITIDPTPAISSVTATPPFICTGGNSQLLATATVPSLLITEVTLFRTGTGATSPYPAFVVGQDLVEISNISSSPVDISGYTLSDYANNAAATTHPTLTFPAGTIIPANSVAVVCLGTGTNSPANLYFNTGGTSDFWSSTGLVGIVLRNGATIIDAVGCGSGYAFNAATNVTAVHWSGFAPTGSGIAGAVRTAATDNNTGSDWTASSVAIQTIGTYSNIYTAPPAITYSWSPATYLSATNIDNPMANAVMATTTYTVTASVGACSSANTVTLTAGAALTATGSVAPSSTVCEGANVTFSVTPTGGGSPYSYTWTGPNSFSSSLQNPAISGVTPAASGTYTVVVSDGCANTFTVNVGLTVNPAPTISVSPTSATYCTPGPGVALTASGSSVSYNWSPSTGLSATTGVTVTASPTSNQTYTVVGTDGNSCTASATTTITVGYSPVATTASANPASVCFNGSSQLNAAASATNPLNTYGFTTGTGATLDPMAGATQVLNPGNDDTPTAAPIAIGFTFPFNGTSYTQFSVSPDGWILLGGATAVNQFTNAVTSTTNIPKIYPYWDDLATGTNGNVTYVVTGTAPNRILKVQWFVTVPRNTGGAANSTFQCWMYETTGVFEFRYGTMGTNTASTSVGATATATNFQSVTMSSNTASVVAGNDAQVATPASGRIYTFTPPAISYTWSPATFLSSTTIENPMANNITATTTWTVTPTSGGCTGATATVTVTTGAVLSASGSISPSSTVCEGSNVTLNSTPTGGGAPYTYSWSGPNGFAATTQNPAINGVTVAASGTYTLTVTDACSAVTTVSLTLTVDPMPVVTVTPSAATYCNPGPVVSITATGGGTYSWSPAAGLSSTTVANPDASPAGSTTYTVTVTGANGCTATGTTTITSAPAVTGVVASSTAYTICDGVTVDLNGAVASPINVVAQDFTGGLGAWSVVNGPTSPAVSNWTQQTSPYSLAAGSLNFTNFSTVNGGNFYMSNSDAGGSGTTTNTQLVSPVFSLAGYSSADLSFEHVYQRWASGDNTVAVEISTDGGLNYTSLQAYTSNQGVVTANAQATTAATISLAPYLGQTNVRLRYNYVSTWGYFWLIDDIRVSAVPTYTFAWTSSPVGFTSAVQNPTGVAPTATTTYSLTVSNASGCSASDTAVVTVNALPAVTASLSPSTVCTGDMVTPTGGGATSYTWTGGLTDGVAFSATVSDTYTVTGTDANGCSNTATASLTVNALPTVTASLSPSSTVCTGDMVTPAGGGATSYSWTGGLTDGVAFAATVSDTYTVTGTDANGCSNTATVSLTVNTVPTVTASLSPSSPACAGDMVTPTGGGAATYVWTGGLTDGVAFAATTTDTYTVTGTDANGCSATTTVTLTVNPLPVVTASATDSTVCAGDQITFMGGGATTYTWDNGVTDMVPYTVSASMTFIVTGTDANGCMDTASLAITANAVPNVTVSLPLDTACLLLGPVTLGGESPVGGTWSGTGVTGNVFDPGVAGNGMHAITYTYMDSVTGCSASAVDSMLVDICNGIDNNTVGVAVVYPNPNNGDFTLIPAGSGMVDVMIYNVTGQLVVAEKAIAGQPKQISLEASGVYSVVVVTAEGVRTTQRVVVNR